MSIMSSSTTIPKTATTKTIISTVGTIVATAMVVRSIAQDYVPPEIRRYFYQTLLKSFKHFSNQLTIVINKHDGIECNEIYDAAVVYLGSKVSPNTRRLRVSKPEKENRISFAMERNEEVVDTFKGVQFKWTWECKTVQRPKKYYDSSSEVQYFELNFHKKHKDLALNFYLPYVLKEAKYMKQENKTLKIFTLHSRDIYSPNTWQSISLDHPASFETLAMDGDLKKAVMEDLEIFVRSRNKYRKVGKAWKRGYLLYGPPGTGKSSLIAAMANYLKFDIYDLELTDIKRNSDLRKLLLSTMNKSILVVEDIDCNIEFKDRVAAARTAPPTDRRYQEPNMVTLSGFLNFIDGLWSSCGDERIIIFTTNHKEKLDPALLRPGRMDMHIHMSYCTPCGFKLLASNYLGVKDHKLFGEIKELIRTTEVTPAEVAEQLLKSDEPDVSLASLITFLRTKRNDNGEAKAKKITQELHEPVSKADNSQKANEKQEKEKNQNPQD